MIFMSRALAFYGIACCIALLYFRSLFINAIAVKVKQLAFVLQKICNNNIKKTCGFTPVVYYLVNTVLINTSIAYAASVSAVNVIF